MVKSITFLIIAITLIIIVLGIYGINKAAIVASEAIDSPGTMTVVKEIGKTLKTINDDKVLADVGEIGTLVKNLNDKQIVSTIDNSLTGLDNALIDIRNTQIIPTTEGAIQDVRTLMSGIDDASMTQLNSIVQNCGDGITMEIPKGKLAQFTVDVPGILGDDIVVEIPSSDMSMKLNFPGCRENFNENFSAVIKDTFKRNDLPSRFEKEFHIDSNGQIRKNLDP